MISFSANIAPSGVLSSHCKLHYLLSLISPTHHLYCLRDYNREHKRHLPIYSTSPLPSPIFLTKLSLSALIRLPLLWYVKCNCLLLRLGTIPPIFLHESDRIFLNLGMIPDKLIHTQQRFEKTVVCANSRHSQSLTSKSCLSVGQWEPNTSKLLGIVLIKRPPTPPAARKPGFICKKTAPSGGDGNWRNCATSSPCRVIWSHTSGKVGGLRCICLPDSTPLTVF